MGRTTRSGSRSSSSSIIRSYSSLGSGTGTGTTCLIIGCTVCLIVASAFQPASRIRQDSFLLGRRSGSGNGSGSVGRSLVAPPFSAFFHRPQSQSPSLLWSIAAEDGGEDGVDETTETPFDSETGDESELEAVEGSVTDEMDASPSTPPAPAQAQAQAQQPKPKKEAKPAGHEIVTTYDGPQGGAVHTMTVYLGDYHNNNNDSDDDYEEEEPIVISTGAMGRQAAGSVTLSRGATVLYASAAYDETEKNLGFTPLSVEHQERFSSTGKTSGSYTKRDGRPAEHEILTCRLIDRPLRPMIASGWSRETQLLSWVLSYDGERSADPLAMVASSAALWLSDVPLKAPVAGVEVAYLPDKGIYRVNPTAEEAESSPLSLILAGTEAAVLMIEGSAEFVTEEQMMEAVAFGHSHIRTLCRALDEFASVAAARPQREASGTKEEEGEETTDLGVVVTKEEVVEYVNSFAPVVDELLSSHHPNKKAFGSHQDKVTKSVMKDVLEKYEDSFEGVNVVASAAFKALLVRRLYHQARSTGLRADGRKTDEIRSIDVSHFSGQALPAVHGSALFTRGETQALATATLGDSGMAQTIDTIDGNNVKRFYLQYTFPPSCVGETGRVGAPGRREVGHGNLAERALAATLPTDQAVFPYTVRVESLIMESHGSSSMASVCGGCLALMDAGVPIKAPVAGIAMGLLLDPDVPPEQSMETAVVLSDITGTEDALGTMDFKVAGSAEGITTFQLDIKCEGLSLELMARALEQARVGRLHILQRMAEAGLAEPRPELPATVPKILQFHIAPESIGKIIGPGGKQIRAIIEDFGLDNMNVESDGNGTVQVMGKNATALQEAKAFTEALAAGGGGGGPGGKKGGGADRVEYAGPPPVVNETYVGKITGVHQFGVFLEILPGAEDGSYPGLEGLCHVSELAAERVRNCEAFVGSMNVETLEVKYIGVNNKGKHTLSRKALLDERRPTKPRRVPVVKSNGNAPPTTESPPPSSIHDEAEAEVEADVIFQAIEDLME